MPNRVVKLGTAGLSDRRHRTFGALLIRRGAFETIRLTLYRPGRTHNR
jgi:hypothetical protein